MRPSTVGQTVYPGGRKIDVSSRHDEWTAYAANAVNAHDALVAALKETLNATRWAQSEIEGADGHEQKYDDFTRAIAQARAALAQALPAVAEADGVES